MSEPADITTYRMEATRKTVNERLRERLDERDEAIKALVKGMRDNAHNELLTRGRVDGITELLQRSFIGKLKWLILGK